MHVGAALIFQSPPDGRTDREVYEGETLLGDLVEPLGFESIWSVEHHFTDYTMCPDVMQFLTYWAGRTKHIKLGSMVVVLPWHANPIRVAEQVATLDNLSGGRVMLGLGRGLGRIEFEGMGVPMDESRPRFIEAAEMVLSALETGFCEYDGEYFKQPRREIRPRPFKSFKGRTYAAAVSPESIPIMARLGAGILVIPQKEWGVVTAELAGYRKSFRAHSGATAPAPILGAWTFCDEDAGRAEELAHKYIGEYYASTIKHYELGSGHFAKTKGYESYAQQAKASQALTPEQITKAFVDLHVWGTPEQCYEKVLSVRSKIGCDGYVGIFSYASMPHSEAERNMRLFARQVMPELKKLPPVEMPDDRESAVA